MSKFVLNVRWLEKQLFLKTVQYRQYQLVNRPAQGARARASKRHQQQFIRTERMAIISLVVHPFQHADGLSLYEHYILLTDQNGTTSLSLRMGGVFGFVGSLSV